MTFNEAVIWFLLILAADIIAAVIVPYAKGLWNKPLDLGCDYCEKIHPLNKTPDRKFWLCRGCMAAFLSEHQAEFTEEQMARARRGYRRRIRRRRGDKK